MNGKHIKNRLSRNPRAAAIGAFVGLALCGTVTGGVVLADSGSPSESRSTVRSGDAAAAAELLPPAKKDRSSEGRAADSRERSDRPSRKTRKPAEAPTEKRSDEQDARDKVIERAKTWNPGTDDRVRYSQTRTYKGYRTDCSGYVAMALGLSGPGPNTVGFTSSRLTERIKMSELKKGDLVMDAQGTNTTRHVVIFEKWANKAHTAYWAYEQRGRYGTDYRTRDYGLSSGSEYKAYRPKNL
ncbi:peptidoglycan endopeptidase [Actinomadura spongiicola]|uniref:Peptidoglycan endopeptidase n=1 Tax=Actinomadura spongiicola TaxID=2303421 RepID=A0A372GQD6_9ACTN|nr:C40 family peptidase [Actinomadura spongiicola]RFS87309.1 peptidoglycan endopeptidase [Actinomadura spongiicola]